MPSHQNTEVAMYRTSKNNPKIQMETKRSPIAKAIRSKKSKTQKYKIPSFKIYQRTLQKNGAVLEKNVDAIEHNKDSGKIPQNYSLMLSKAPRSGVGK